MIDRGKSVRPSFLEVVRVDPSNRYLQYIQLADGRVSRYHAISQTDY